MVENKKKAQKIGDVPRSDMSSLRVGDVVRLDFSGNHNADRFWGLVVRQQENGKGQKSLPEVIVIEARNRSEGLIPTQRRWVISRQDDKDELGLPLRRKSQSGEWIPQNYYLHFATWLMDTDELVQVDKPGEMPEPILRRRPEKSSQVLGNIMQRFKEFKELDALSRYSFDLSNPEQPAQQTVAAISPEELKRRVDALQAFRRSQKTEEVVLQAQRIEARLARIEAQKERAANLSDRFFVEAVGRGRGGVEVKRLNKIDARMVRVDDYINEQAGRDAKTPEEEVLKSAFSAMDIIVSREMARAKRRRYRADTLWQYTEALKGEAYEGLEIDGKNIDTILDGREHFLDFIERFTDDVQTIGKSIHEQYRLENGRSIIFAPKPSFGRQ